MHVYCAYIFLFYIFWRKFGLQIEGGAACQQRDTDPCNEHSKRYPKQCKTPLMFSGLEPPSSQSKGITSTTTPYWHICCCIFLRYISSFVIYTCIHVHTCIYVHIHPFKSIYLLIHAYTYVYVCIRTFSNTTKSLSEGVLEGKLPTFSV